MLRGIQKASTGRIGKFLMTVVLGALALSFAVWGIGDIFRGFGRSALAKVGGVEIGIEQFRTIYNDKLQQLGRQVGRPISQDQARALGYDRQVLGQMIAETAIDEQTRQMGLHISDADVAKSITSDPNFQGPTGFDRARFEAIIRQAGYTEQRYVAEQRKQILRRQLIDTVAGDVTVPKAAVEAAYRYRNEERAIEYIVLDRSQAGTVAAPSQEELAKYYDEHKAQFRAPEYRKVVYVAVTPANIANWDAVVDDAEARAIFEKNKARYSTPEQRHVQQIIFPNADEAKAAADKIAQGTSFESLAKERGLAESDIDLGTIPKSGIIDPTVADAAFSLKEGEVSAPVQGRFGTALVRAVKVVPGTSKTYEEVAKEIKADIALQNAKAQVSSLRDKLEDARAGGETLAEAAGKLKLVTHTIEAVDRNGRGLDGVPLANLPKGAELVSGIFSTDVGVETDPLQFDNGYVWYDVVGVTPSRERPLDEVKTELEIRYTNDEITKRLTDKAKGMVDKLKSGTALKDVAAEEKVKVETASGVKRGDPTENLSAQTISAVFRTAKDAPGSAGGVQATQHVVFRVTDVKVPELDMNSPEAKRLSESLRASYSDELLAGFGERLEQDVGVSINENALSQISGGGSTF